MKRITKFAVAGVAAVALTAAIGSASASAAVLCKSASINNVCPAGDVYGVNTKVNIDLENGTFARFSTPSGVLLHQCTDSQLNMTVSNAGTATEPVKATNDVYWFSACSKTMTPLGTGITEVFWKSGTHNGEVFHRADVFQINTVFGKCNYTVWGPGELVGGTNPKLVYNDGGVFLTSGGAACPNKLLLDASYEITNPMPLYVEQK